MPTTEFDSIASRYRELLDEGLAISGEAAPYFAQARVRWLGQCLRRERSGIRVLMDYGCGVGETLPLLKECFHPDRILGVDASRVSLDLAARRADPGAEFRHESVPAENASVDLIYCNGVFHHIPPPERHAVATALLGWLRPGGWLALWENNPWNPGTRWLMKRLPFDREAVPLAAKKARALMSEVGFETLRVDHLFVFPRPLRYLRVLEPALASLPIGGQYQVLCRKPHGMGNGASYRNED